MYPLKAVHRDGAHARAVEIPLPERPASGGEPPEVHLYVEEPVNEHDRKLIADGCEDAIRLMACRLFDVFVADITRADEGRLAPEEARGRFDAKMQAALDARNFLLGPEPPADFPP